MWTIVKVKSLSCVQLFATPWTVAYYTPSSMGFSRQEYWSGLPLPSPEDLPDPGSNPFPTLKADALPSEPPGKSQHCPNEKVKMRMLIGFALSVKLSEVIIRKDYIRILKRLKYKYKMV